MTTRHRSRIGRRERTDADREGEPAAAADMGRVAVERIADAPVIWFDGTPVFGLCGDVAAITLETLVQEPDPNGTIHDRRVAVAHLRFSLRTIPLLEAAVSGIKAILERSSAE